MESSLNTDAIIISLPTFNKILIQVYNTKPDTDQQDARNSTTDNMLAAVLIALIHHLFI